MTIATIFLMLWAAMWAAEGTWLGRKLQRLLVEWPARMLDRLTRGHLLLAIGLIGICAIVGLCGGADGIGLFGTAAPDLVTFAATFEISAYLDAIAAAALAASTLRFGTIRRFVTRASMVVSQRFLRKPRAPRSARVIKRLPANDDEGPYRDSVLAAA